MLRVRIKVIYWSQEIKSRGLTYVNNHLISFYQISKFRSNTSKECKIKYVIRTLFFDIWFKRVQVISHIDTRLSGMNMFCVFIGKISRRWVLTNDIVGIIGFDHATSDFNAVIPHQLKGQVRLFWSSGFAYIL